MIVRNWGKQFSGKIYEIYVLLDIHDVVTVFLRVFLLLFFFAFRFSFSLDFYTHCLYGK